MAKVVDPNNLDDPEKLRNLMANAERLGREDIAVKCQIRIAELKGRGHSGSLEREFWTAIYVAEEFRTRENGRTTLLSRTRQKYDRDGAKKCIQDLATRKDFAPGFQIVHDSGRPDLTFEAILLRHRGQFDPDVVRAVNGKLLSGGFSQETVDGWVNHVQG